MEGVVVTIPVVIAEATMLASILIEGLLRQLNLVNEGNSLKRVPNKGDERIGQRIPEAVIVDSTFDKTIPPFPSLLPGYNIDEY